MVDGIYNLRGLIQSMCDRECGDMTLAITRAVSTPARGLWIVET